MAGVSVVSRVPCCGGQMFFSRQEALRVFWEERSDGRTEARQVESEGLWSIRPWAASPSPDTPYVASANFFGATYVVWTQNSKLTY